MSVHFHCIMHSTVLSIIVLFWFLNALRKTTYSVVIVIEFHLAKV